VNFLERGIPPEFFGMPRERPHLGMTTERMQTEVPAMAKAESDGTYTLEQNGETLHFFIAKGDELPDGAKFQATEATQKRAAAEESEEHARAASAPAETKAKGAAPENKSA
jgi:hypothetical protein